MPAYIAFLRAINAGKGRTVKMAVLRAAFDELGLQKVTTFFATGNIAFETGIRDPGELEQTILEKLRHVLGFDADAFVRTPAEMAAIANCRPFTPAELEGCDLNIIFLPRLPAPEVIAALEGSSSELNRYRVVGREVYWLRRMSPGVNEYKAASFGKFLAAPYTVRGARTVYRLAEIAWGGGGG